MTHVPATAPIPERPSWPLVGHALDVPSGIDGLHHLMAEAGELGPLFKLRVFDRAPAVREAFMELYRKNTGGDERQAALWLAGLQESDRYVEDVWAG